MGVWVVSSLVSIQKTKEIGIRKAIGASTLDILKFFMKDFASLLLLANLIAWPVSYLILKQWFKNFAIHIDLQIYEFLIASFFILVLTLAILARHALKVAKSNTIESLRDE
jgi:putative ABC transport system permease protein